jgi:hypothetical protein
VIVVVPVLLRAVIALINTVVIAVSTISTAIKSPGLRAIFHRLTLLAVNEPILTAPLVYDIFNARFTATHT